MVLGMADLKPLIAFRLGALNRFLMLLGLCAVVEVWDGVGEKTETRLIITRHRAWMLGQKVDIMTVGLIHSSALSEPSSADTSAAGR